MSSKPRNRKIAIVGAVCVLAAAIGGGAALASGQGDDDATDTPITGAALAQAKAAALAYTGEGRVTATEAGDEESAYEVEVTRPDGSQVDVQLDRSFTVVSAEDDGHDEQGDD